MWLIKVTLPGDLFPPPTHTHTHTPVRSFIDLLNDPRPSEIILDLVNFPRVTPPPPGLKFIWTLSIFWICEFPISQPPTPPSRKSVELCEFPNVCVSKLPPECLNFFVNFSGFQVQPRFKMSGFQSWMQKTRVSVVRPILFHLQVLSW